MKDDRLLVEAARRGDHAAFRMLMDRHSPTVLGFLIGKLRTPSDDEDILQDVFVSAFSALDSLRKPEHFSAFIIGITRKKLADYYRRLQREDAGQKQLRLENEQKETSNPESSGSPVEDEALAEAVENAVGRLGGNYRVVVYLALYEEMNSSEIAGRLGLKSSTVRMRLQRGLKKLRTELERRGLSPFEKE